MNIRARNLLYALALSPALVLFVAAGPKDGPKDKPDHGKGREAVFEPGKWPAPIFAGGAMPVQWTNIVGPTPTDHFGLYAPEASDADALEWAYVSCSQTPSIARATGTCGFIIPSTVPPGTYEIRLFSGAGARLATSKPLEVLDGGWGQ